MSSETSTVWPCRGCRRPLSESDSRRELVLVLWPRDRAPECLLSREQCMWYCPSCRDAAVFVAIDIGGTRLRFDDLEPHIFMKEGLSQGEICLCRMCGDVAAGLDSDTFFAVLAEACYAGPSCVERKAIAMICPRCCEGLPGCLQVTP